MPIVHERSVAMRAAKYLYQLTVSKAGLLITQDDLNFELPLDKFACLHIWVLRIDSQVEHPGLYKMLIREEDKELKSVKWSWKVESDVETWLLLSEHWVMWNYLTCARVWVVVVVL